eukprot:TRINITY_DN5404_c1_g1_i1.p1 TRINITY_DN5404_c1_g1~~TRINITY_DN5404_c1_g1_i1.p1  ORF type:complete len:367 (+),score=61.75 TRINITY_DN5404_c1_g1_i1:54-1103(+)
MQSGGNSSSNVESGYGSSMWSSGSETEHNRSQFHKRKGRRAPELTVVTTPWYPDGVLKEGITLGGEVMALNKLMSLTAKERTLRANMRSALQEGGSKIWPNATVKVYGSFAYDCALPESTLDFVCEDCGDLTSFEDMVGELGAALSFRVEHVFQCAVDGQHQAFAKFKEPSGITANVTFFESKSPARQAVLQARKKFDEYPAARAVYDVVRMILKQSGCSDPATGGLSSYAMLLMIFYVCTQSKNVHDPGQLLVDFFTLYSHPFTYKINPKSGKPQRADAGVAIFVQDIVTDVNVASECTKAPQVNSLCKACAATLAKWTSGKWVGYRGRSPLSSILAYDTLWDRAEAV